MKLPYRIGGALAMLGLLVVAPALAFEPPIAVDIDPDPDTVEVNLTASETTWQFIQGINTIVYAYNGSVPGPTIEAELGNTIVVNFTNNLPEATTIHWHGIDVPASMDGSHIAQAWVEPGGTFRYEFDVNRASLFWYHPHVRTHDQVEKGLYGGVLVRDPAKDAALGLTGLEERIVIFDDVLLDTANEIVPAFSFTDPRRNAEYHLNGREGNHLLVNGKWAEEVALTVDNGQPQRWRVLNAANTSFSRLGIEELGVDLYWIGTDASLLEFRRKRRVIDPFGPVPTRARGEGSQGPVPLHPTVELLAKTLEGVFLLPGERMDLVFTPLGNNGDQFTIWQHDWLRGRHSVIYDPNGNLVVIDDPLDGIYPSQPYIELTLNGANPGTGEFVPPANLQTTITVPGAVQGDLPVTFGHGNPDPAGNVTMFAQADFSTGTMVPLPSAKIDSFNAHDVNVGETWNWEVTNLTHGDHPFHTHGFPFVLDEIEFIDMEDPTQNIVFTWPFKMLKDTIRAPARGGNKGMSMSIVRARAYFDPSGREDDVAAQGQLPTFDPNGDYVSGGWLFHCHVLEHAAKGMLSWYEVHDPADPFTFLGKQLAGANGYPSLTVQGDPAAGTSLLFNVVDAAPNSTVQLIMGIEAARTPYKGGEVVPRRQKWWITTADANGDAFWNNNAWLDIVSGRTVYVQAVVNDPTGPEGKTISNAVSFVVP